MHQAPNTLPRCVVESAHQGSTTHIQRCLPRKEGGYPYIRKASTLAPLVAAESVFMTHELCLELKQPSCFLALSNTTDVGRCGIYQTPLWTLKELSLLWVLCTRNAD